MTARDLSRSSDSLRNGRSGDRIQVGGEIFRNHADRPWGPPSLLYNGYRVFPGVNRPGRVVNHPSHLEPRLKKSRALFHLWALKKSRALLHLWAFVACSRKNFTFFPLIFTQVREMGIVNRMQSGPRGKASRNLPSLLNMEEIYSWKRR